MKFTVTIAGRDLEVEVLGPEVRVGGRRFAAALLRVPGTPICHLVSERNSRTYALLRQGANWQIQQGGEVWPAEVVDERTAQLRALLKDQRKQDAPGLVRAPMPGLVLRVDVEAGQEIAAGAGLVVLEAMKMENEIRSSGPGRVKSVLVEPGQAVEKGTPLVEVVGQG
ncbi:MAG: acetyl-CoA carboxylase biotin carboxyl carrier protein subunit [Gemmatimonadetes bacterium]|nr:acetyl-CoA carboxylase biotin carboxyl carrier protein subunit [Gemmatimonadota bacterium]